LEILKFLVLRNQHHSLLHDQFALARPIARSGGEQALSGVYAFAFSLARNFLDGLIYLLAFSGPLLYRGQLKIVLFST
jgi:hypothetical protein